jgi:hypothetical protein
MTTIWRGAGLEDCGIGMSETSVISMVPVIPITENDDLTVSGEVKTYSGDPIALYHGETEIGTISNGGSFSRPFTAGDSVNEVTMRPTGESLHQIGYLEITRD